MAPKRELALKQEAEVNAYATQRARTVLRRIEAGRKSLLAEFAELDDSPRKDRLREILGQVENIASQMKADIQAIGASDGSLGAMAVRHWGEVATDITGNSLTLSIGQVSSDVLTRFSLAELDKITTITADYALQTLRSGLLRSLGMKGENPRVLARQLLTKKGFLTKRYALVETIVRTEASNIYNAQSLNAIEAGNLKYGLSLNKKIIESIQPKRNHPISLVTNNLVVPVTDAKGEAVKFKVKVSDVQEAARKIGHRGNLDSSIFWRKENGYYVGNSLPAHYNERGIVVATDDKPTDQKKED